MTIKQPLNLPAESGIKRILIIKWSALGDLATASAIFEDIANAFPQAQIDLNTLPQSAFLFRHDPRFNQIIDINIRDKEHKFKKSIEWIKLINKNRYDLVVDLQSNDRSRILLTLLGLFARKIPYRVGNNDQFPYNIRPQEKIVNTFRRYQAAIKQAGIPALTEQPVLHYPAKNTENVEAVLSAHKMADETYAVFMPGCQAAGYLKRWGAENYAKLGSLLRKRGIQKIVLIGAEDEREECERIRQLGSDWTLNLCGETALLDIIPLCERASCVVSNDNGTARIAAVTQTPIAMVFGPTYLERDIPGNKHLVAFQASLSELNCIRCFQKHCSHHTCMKLITPEQVLSGLIKLGVGHE